MQQLQMVLTLTVVVTTAAAQTHTYPHFQPHRDLRLKLEQTEQLVVVLLMNIMLCMSAA